MRKYLTTYLMVVKKEEEEERSRRSEVDRVASIWSKMVKARDKQFFMINVLQLKSRLTTIELTVLKKKKTVD